MSGRALSGAILALAVLVVASGTALIWLPMTMILDPHRVQRTYYIPSESMLPTLAVDDRVRPLKVTQPQRGQIVIFHASAQVRIARVIARGGDTVELRKGRVVLNGRPAMLGRIGPGPVVADTATTEFLERLPGRPEAHHILDAGPSPQDDMSSIRIPSGHLFVLGDNRDFAADSRFAPDQGGVGLVAQADVLGVVDRLLWSRGFNDRGKAIK